MANLGLSLGMSCGDIAIELTNFVPQNDVSAAASLPLGTTIDVNGTGIVTVTVPEGVYQGVHQTTLAALPTFIVDPVIDQTSATVGDDLTVTDGLFIYDANAGTPVVVTTWIVDGVYVNDTGLNMPEGSAVVRQRVTVGSDTVTADSAALTVGTGRGIAEIVTDFGGDWFDPTDLTTIWQTDTRTTQVTASGQSVHFMDGQAGNISFESDAGHPTATYSTAQTVGTLRFVGSSREKMVGGPTFSIASGLEKTVVMKVRFDNVTETMFLMTQFETDSTQRSLFLAMSATGELVLSGWQNNSTQVTARSPAGTFAANTNYIVSAVIRSTGAIEGYVDGVLVCSATATPPMKTLAGSRFILGALETNFDGSLKGHIFGTYLNTTTALSSTDLDIIEAEIGALS